MGRACLPSDLFRWSRPSGHPPAPVLAEPWILGTSLDKPEDDICGFCGARRLIRGKKQHIAIADGRSPGGVAAEIAHHGEGFDPGAVLRDEPRRVAVGAADRF